MPGFSVIRLTLPDDRYFELWSSKWDQDYEEMTKEEFYERKLDSRIPGIMSFVSDDDFVYGDYRDEIGEEIIELTKQVGEAKVAEEKLDQLKRQRKRIDENAKMGRK